MANATSTHPALSDRSLNILLWLVATGFFMQTLDSTIVDTALPAMARSLGESPLRMQSVVIAYSLTMAMLISASGWLADRFGTRRIFQTAIVVFTLGSLCCAASRSLFQLAASRVLQAAGGSMLLPVGRLAVLRAFPRSKFLDAMSFVTVPGLIGPLLGPTLGGWLVEIASWHWIFLINLPIGVLGCIATHLHMPEVGDRVERKFDVTGFLLLATTMASLILALDGLAELGFRASTVMLLVIFGLACLAAYWLHAVHYASPVLPLRLFQVSSFRVGLLGNLFSRIGSGSMPFLIPLLLQVGIGFSPMQAGMTMIPTAVAGILSKRYGSRLIHRIGYRRVLTVNTLLVALGMASFALLSEHEPALVRIVHLFLFGIVNSLQFTAMNTITLKDLDGVDASSGNSMLSMVQMLSISLGIACAAAVLSTFAGGLLNQQAGLHLIPAFHATFLCMGTVTAISACIFWQLNPQDEDQGAGDERVADTKTLAHGHVD